MPSDRPERQLLDIYETALREFGDTPRGAWWPNQEDQVTRFDVMLDIVERYDEEGITLCDLGCGTGELLSHISRRGLKNISYVGVDSSALALSFARKKFPEATFLHLDITDPEADLDGIACDYLVANGLFATKWHLKHDEMRSFLWATIRRVWPYVRRALAFNVMSKVVDWERDDLFHLPMDEAAALLHELAGRNVYFRADYGLYEYTAVVRRNPLEIAAPPVSRNPLPARTPIPVMRPKLPDARQLVPYLRRMDQRRIYTNHGPLVGELEERLCGVFGLPDGSCVSAGSGTAALAGAVLATAGRARDDRPLALLPAFTFAATAIALEECGYALYFTDVNPDTWTLETDAIANHPQLERVGVVVPVAPFGRPIPLQAWQRFQSQTNIPVVVDGAATFDTAQNATDRYFGRIPVAMSFHATKTLSTGEGGAVFTTDLELSKRITQALNFGFHTSRESLVPSINGKLSEYHAAVGLAELDNWARKRDALLSVAKAYRHEMVRAGRAGELITAPDISSCYVLLNSGTAERGRRVCSSLREDEIDFRFWYGRGLTHHAHFAGAPHDSLATTDGLAQVLIGLPVAPDLSEESVARVVSRLQAF